MGSNTELRSLKYQANVFRKIKTSSDHRYIFEYDVSFASRGALKITSHRHLDTDQVVQDNDERLNPL